MRSAARSRSRPRTASTIRARAPSSRRARSAASALQAETGGAFGDELGYFVTASHLDEDGWRDFSPTEAQQLFAKLDVARRATSRSTSSLTHVDTDLDRQRRRARGPARARSRGDLHAARSHARTRSRCSASTASRPCPPSVTLRGNLYVRASDIDTLNGDDSDFEECEDTPGFICEEEGDDEEIVLDENGDADPGRRRASKAPP